MSYEFSGDHELVIDKFSKISFLLGFALILFGILDAVAAVLNPDVPEIVASRFTNSVLRAFLGLGIIYPAVHFRRVVTTEGEDIVEILSGVKKQYLGLNYMIVIFGLVIISQFIVIGGLLL